MDASVLLVSQCRESQLSMKALFPRERYILLSADGVARARRMLPKKLPDIVLLGEDCVAGCREELDLLAEDCLIAEIPVFYLEQGRVRSLVDAGYSSDEASGGSARAILWPLENQLLVRRLTRELHRAQEWLHQKQLELEESLVSATHIQKSLVPKVSPRMPGMQCAWQFLPCQKVGGDLFNVLKLDEETVLLYTLDVSGHGFPAAMVTVAISQSLTPSLGQLVKRAKSEPPYYELTPPAEVLEALDREYPVERFEKFFTICYMLVNVKTGRVRYSNAAGPLPILVRACGTPELLKEGGTIIGMGGLIPYLEDEVRLQRGDRLFLYTDGLLEQENHQRDQFGLDRLVERLEELRGRSLDVACEQTIETLLQFSRGVPAQDDITLLGFEFSG